MASSNWTISCAIVADFAEDDGQLSFQLIDHRALLLLPYMLFTAAVPAWDELLTDFLAEGAAEGEDAAMFATSTPSNSPPALMSQAGITVINAAGGNANGGNIAYADLLAALEKSAEAKVKPPLAWYSSPRTLNRLLSLQSSTPMPILQPTAATLPAQAHWMLLGWPLYLSTGIPNNESVGSGPNQSHLILVRPRKIHIGQDRDISIAVSDQFAWDANQIALRVGHRLSFQYQQAAAFVVVAGIN